MRKAQPTIVHKPAQGDVDAHADEVQRRRDELAASALPDDVRAATTTALDDVLAHPATAKRAGDVRW